MKYQKRDKPRLLTRHQHQRKELTRQGSKTQEIIKLIQQETRQERD